MLVFKMEKMKSSCYFLFLTINILATGINTQTTKVDVTPARIITKEGESANILCRVAEPLGYCRILVPGEPTFSFFAAQTEQESYFGEGLDKGQCGVTLRNVKTHNHGNVTCNLGLFKSSEATGYAEIVVALPPIRPEIEFPSNTIDFVINTEFLATCVSRDGRPAANLTWFLGDEQLTDSFDTQDITKTVNQNNQTLYTSTLQISRTLRPEDNGKDLFCRAYHFALKQKYEEVKTQITVRFPPQQSNPTHIYGLILGQTALITVTIRANPRPQTQWLVDGQAIQQGTRLERFEASEPVDLGGGEFNVTLAIADLTLEDTTKVFTLKANNQYGFNDYTVRISSLEAAPVGPGMDIGAIVGIAAVVVVVLLIVITVIVARIKGKWCFSGGTLRTDIGLDSEAQVAHNYDDNEKDHEEFHPQENGGGQPNTTDITDELKHEKLKNGNGNGTDASKTNTSV